MNETVFSILLFVLGLIVGLVSIIVINILKKKNQEKEADSIIEKAKKAKAVHLILCSYWKYN